jgi:hypothetical protein
MWKLGERLNGVITGSSIAVSGTIQGTTITATTGVVSPYVHAAAAGALTLQSYLATSGSSVAIVMDTAAGLTTGDKLLSVRMGTVEKAFIDYAGNLSLVGGIKGAKDIRTNLTPVNGGTVTMDFSVGNMFYVDCSALGGADAFTIAVSNHPTNAYMFSYTWVLKTGAAVPTITLPAGWTAPVYVVSVDNVYTNLSYDGGATTRTLVVGAW